MRGLRSSSSVLFTSVLFTVAATAMLATIGCDASSSGSKPDGASAADTAPADTVSGTDTVTSDVGTGDPLDVVQSDTPEPTDTTLPSDVAVLEDTDKPDVPMPDDVPALEDLPIPLDVPAPEDIAINPAECPVEQPMPGGACKAEGASCSWGTESCCGKTYPSFACSCSGGSWACYNTDACMGAQFMCPDTVDTDAVDTDAVDTDAVDTDAGPGPDQDVVTPEGPATLLAAGWSFGECMGACIGVLEFEGASVTLTVKSYDGTISHLASGILTTGGAANLETALTALDGVPLDPVYGCPDCADGGAKTITITRGDVISTHSYEYGYPPPVFTTLDAIIFGAAQGLKDCVTSEAVVVQGQCPAPIP